MKEQINHTKFERLLLSAARTFNSTLEYEELIELVLKLVTSAVGAEAAMVFRVDHNRTDMKIRYMNCGDCKLKGFKLDIGSGVVGWVAQYKEPVVLNDAAADPRVQKVLEEKIGSSIRSLISVPLIGKGQMIGVIEAINKVDGEFTDEDQDILLGLSNQIAVAIDNANLYRAVKREALQKELLYKIGIDLSQSLDLDDLLDRIMTSLKQVVEYDAGGVFIVDPSGDGVDVIYSVGYEAECRACLYTKMGEGLVGAVAKSGDTIIVADVKSDSRYINSRVETQSEIVVPISIDGRTTGVLNLESNRIGAYGDCDVALIKAFASQAAISLERARVHKQLLDGKGLEEQLNIAREIQRSFLPPGDPKIKGYDVSGRNISSGQVGGDYYDFIHIVDGQTGVAIADVAGKGIPASLIMASFRASMIAEIRNNYSIRTIWDKVNALMVESLKPGNYVTAVYGVLDSKNHILTFSNGGHNQPILLRKSGEIEFLKEGGPVLGVSTAAVFEERPIFLNAGDLVLFYTDGVSEVFSSDGREFGVASIVDVLKKHKTASAVEIQDRIYEAVTAFASPDHIFDDLTMVVVKRMT